MERVGAAVGAALALGIAGCGSQGPEPGAPKDDGASRGRIDDEGFETAPTVAFPAPATTRFGNGHRLCSEHRSELSPELATALGYDVAGDRAALEATQVRDVLTSRDGASSTVVHYRGRIARILRVDRDAPAGIPLEEALPAGCPNGVEYELIEQVYTEDGAVRGAFLAHVSASELDEPTARTLDFDVDLRNFTGELPVQWIDTPVYAFAAAHVAWTIGPVEVPRFELTPTVWAAPVSDGCDWGACRDDADAIIPSSYGVRTDNDPDDYGEVLASWMFTPRSLTEVRARTVYNPDVHLWVTASMANTLDSSSAHRVHVTARVDGQQLMADALDLAANADRLPEGYVGGYIDLGPLPEGTTVELDVREQMGLAAIRSHVVVDHCDVAHATASCGGTGCTAAASLTIVPAGCQYQRPFDGL